MQGKTINGFTLQYPLGTGGMAEVWYAENKIGKKAAVKILLPKLCLDENVVMRFLTEAKVMVKLNHPNIRQVYDYGDIDGRPAIVMEYLEGNDLKAWLKQGQRFTDEELIRWWNQLVDVLNYTHQKGIVHRDIKPGNIFIDNECNIKLLDFGIAKIRESISSTQTGQKLGTLMYMSPEQVKDSKHIYYHTDAYSLAVTFAHLLSGKKPYDSDTSSDFEISEQIVYKPLDLSEIPASWRSFLSPYLNKVPEKRPELKPFSVTKKRTTSKTAKQDDEGTIVDEVKPHIDEEVPPGVDPETGEIIEGWEKEKQVAPTQPLNTTHKVEMKGSTVEKPKKTIENDSDETVYNNDKIGNLSNATERPKRRNKILWFIIGGVITAVALLVLLLPQSKQSALYAILDKDGKIGFIDKQGHVVIEPRFDRIDYHGKDNYGRRMNSYFVDEELVGVVLDGKWGFIDRNGHMVIYPQFDSVRLFFEGLAAVEKDDNWGFIDQDGRMIISPQFDYVGDFEDGLAWALTNDKYGVIDKQGNWIVRPVYDEVDYYCEGRAIVRIGDYDSGKRGFIDKSGKEVVSPKYDMVEDYSEGMAVVRVGDWKTGKRGYIDKSGNLIIDIIYENAGDFYEGLARVKMDGKWGFIDKTGKYVILPQYDGARDFSNGVAVIQINDKYGLVDKSGKQIVAPKYLDIRGDFSKETDGLAAVCLDYKWGFIDKKGNEVVRPHYDDYQFFSEGFAAVRIGDEQKGKWYFIDKMGKRLNEVKCDIAGYFSNGLALVGWKDDKFAYIDMLGNEVYAFLDLTDYVDMGLPSGLLWKNKNEVGYYTLYDANIAARIVDFPNDKDFQELMNECVWLWTGHGYKITGPNGKYIFLPASGQIMCNGKTIDVGSSGNYWSQLLDASDDKYSCLCFWDQNYLITKDDECVEKSVRCIKNLKFYNRLLRNGH